MSGRTNGTGEHSGAKGCGQPPSYQRGEHTNKEDRQQPQAVHDNADPVRTEALAVKARKARCRGNKPQADSQSHVVIRHQPTKNGGRPNSNAPQRNPRAPIEVE